MIIYARTLLLTGNNLDVDTVSQHSTGHLTYLTTLDLGHNNLTGHLTRYYGDFYLCCLVYNMTIAGPQWTVCVQQGSRLWTCHSMDSRGLPATHSPAWLPWPPSTCRVTGWNKLRTGHSQAIHNVKVWQSWHEVFFGLSNLLYWREI